MATIQAKQFTNENVDVDDNRYENCVFTNCNLVYRGGGLPVFAGCQFPQTTIQLAGEAFQTVTFLKGMRRAGLSAAVDRVTAAISSGNLPMSGSPQPAPALHTGENYGQLFVWQGVFIGGTLLLALAIWYAQFQFPVFGGLEAGRPLEQEFPIADMPNLPENLARSYDVIRDRQLDLLDNTEWVDEAAGVVRIPVNDAMALLIGGEVAPPAETDVDEAEAEFIDENTEDIPLTSDDADTDTDTDDADSDDATDTSDEG